MYNGHIAMTVIFGIVVVGGLVGVEVKALTKRITTGSAKLSFKEAAGAFAAGAVAGGIGASATGIVSTLALTGGAATAINLLGIGMEHS